MRKQKGVFVERLRFKKTVVESNANLKKGGGVLVYPEHLVHHHELNLTTKYPHLLTLSREN